MNEICIYIHLDPYLRQWFIHDQGGLCPVRLVKGSVESLVLRQYLTTQPKGEPIQVAHSESDLPIIIPHFRLKDPMYYNYLPPKGLELLIETIRTRFDMDLWDALFGMKLKYSRQDTLINAWMESRGIEFTETNWNAIAKRFQRLRNRYYQATHRKKKKK